MTNTTNTTQNLSTMALIGAALKASLVEMSTVAWLSDEAMRGAKVKLFRDYADGDHRANITKEMRELLRIDDAGRGSLTEFNDNYMQIIIDTMNDRLQVTGIEADTTAATQWATETLEWNRFDGLQTDVHDATIRDGKTFVMVDAIIDANQQRRVRMTLEPAFDGESGVLALYGSAAARQPLLAVKIWQETTERVADTTRINVYFPNRIVKYVTDKGQLVPYLNEQGVNVEWWTMDGSPTGEPIGGLAVPFINRATIYNHDGISEIENAVPIQDALNRTFYSMVASAELTGFPVSLFVGMKPTAALKPGVALYVAATNDKGEAVAPDVEDIEWFKSISLHQIEPGDITTFLKQAQWLKREIFDVTNTPAQDDAAADASGESLKQREIKLLGKVQRFQTKIGNAWEDVMVLAHRVARANGLNPPEYRQFRTRWASAEIRDDSAVIANALKVREAVGDEEFLNLIAPVFGYDAVKVKALLKVVEKQREQAMRDAMNATNRFLDETGAASNSGTEGRVNGVTAAVN